MARIFYSIYQFLAKSKLRFMLAVVLLIGPMVYFALQLRLEEDISKMMPDDRNIEKLTDLLQNSKFTDRLVFNIYNPDTTAPADPDRLIAFADQLVDSLRQQQPAYIKEIAYEVSMDSMAAVMNTIYDNLPLFLEDADYAQLEQMLTDSAMERVVNRNFRTLMSPASAMLKKNVINDPLGMTPMGLLKLQRMQFSDVYQIYNGHILSKDGKNLIFFVVPAHPSDETGENTHLITAIDAYSDSLKAKEPLTVEYFGPVAIAVANAGRMKRDIQVTTSVASIFLILGIYYFYRSKRIFLLIFIPITGGAMFAMALMFLIKVKISAIALGVTSVLLGVAIDYSLHTITHFQKVRSTRQLIYDITRPIMTCSLTTAGTLMGLVFVKSEALREMGMFAAFSVIGSAVFTIVFLPVLLSWGRKNEKLENEPAPILKLEKLLEYPFHKLKWLNFSIIALLVISIVFASEPSFESDMNNINYMPEHLKTAEDNLDAINSYRLKNIYLVSEGKDLQEALRINERTEQELLQLKGRNIVQQYTNVSTLLMSEGRQQEKIASWNQFWTPERRAYVQTKITEYSVPLGFKAEAFNPFYETLNKDFKPVPPEALESITSMVLKDYISEGPSGASIVSLIRVEEKDKQTVYGQFEDREQVLIFDKRYITDKLVGLIREDFNLLVSLSFFIVFVLLWFFHGNFLLALIVVQPVVISWYFTLGLMALFGIQFNIINIVISTFLYGVGVDYSVFIMRGLLQDYRQGINHLASYKSSVVVSAFTTIVGVGALFFAVHPALKSIALSVVFGSTAIILVAFTLVPAAFNWLVRDKHGNLRHYPITLRVLWDTFYFYFMVVVGSVLAPVAGLVIFSMVFVPMKWRKLAFHYVIYAWGRVYMVITFAGRYRVHNPHGEDFKKPSIIICNHLSLLDTPAMLRLHPKLVILTNDWVRRSPLFGFATRMADMHSVSSGIDAILPDLQKLVDDGYSIVVFPEGTRSPDGEVHRFHKGAFYIAEQLKLDIIPVFLHGTRYIIGKGRFWGKGHQAVMQINPRIAPTDKRFGENYTERAKQMRRYYIEQIPAFHVQVADANYLRQYLIDNYQYKGLKIEWQLWRTLRQCQNFEPLNAQVPNDARIAIIGAGYGFSAYMLQMLSPSRTIDAYEADEVKRRTGEHAIYKNERISFYPTEQLASAAGYDVVVWENFGPECFEKALALVSKGGKLIVAGEYYKTYGAELLKRLPAGYEQELMGFEDGYVLVVVEKKG